MNNEVFYDNKEKGYYLSYNPITYTPFDIFLCKEENIGRDETAICIRKPWKCLILYGDHREAMLSIADDLEALKKYWSEQPDKGDTSDDLECA